MTNSPTSTLPALGGISLKPAHYEELLEHNPDIGFLEIHPENYMVKGGLQHFYLEKIRERYPLSMHGVGMSLGSASGISGKHLDELALLVDRYSPNAVSEHLAWSHGEEVFTNDLLPLPYTEESLKLVATNIDKVQTKLKRKILVENPSTYIEFDQSEIAETEFLTALVKKTGCGLLLDVNNTYVNCRNHNRDPKEYIDNYPLKEIGEIHLAGHSVFELSGEKNHLHRRPRQQSKQRCLGSFSIHIRKFNKRQTAIDRMGYSHPRPFHISFRDGACGRISS